MFLYSLYSSRMSKAQRKGVEEARSQLPALLAEAARGRTTIITRHGRSIAALVPAERAEKSGRQMGISALAGSGRGFWGRNPVKAVRKLKDEWSR